MGDLADARVPGHRQVHVRRQGSLVQRSPVGLGDLGAPPAPPSGSGSRWASGTSVATPGRSGSSSACSRSSSASSPLLGSNGTMESEFVGWLLAFAIFMYLNYPGVRDQFVQHEMSLLTPDQRAAMEKLAAANAAAAAAMAAPTPPAGSARRAARQPGRADQLATHRVHSDGDRPARVGLFMSGVDRGTVSGRRRTGSRRRRRPPEARRSRRARRCPAPSGTTCAGAWRTRRCAGRRGRSRCRASALPSRTAHASR